MSQQSNNPFVANYVNNYLNQPPANRNNPYDTYGQNQRSPYEPTPSNYPIRNQPPAGQGGYNPEYATFQESPYKNPSDSPFTDPTQDQGGYRMYPNIPGAGGNPPRAENRAVTQAFQKPHRSEPEAPIDPSAATVLSQARWKNFHSYLQDQTALTYKVSPAEKNLMENNSWFWKHEKYFDIAALVVLAIMFIFDLMISMVRPVFPDICLLIIMVILIIGAYGKHVNSGIDSSSDGAVHVPNTNPQTQTTWLGYNDIYRILPFCFLATAVLDIVWLIIYGNNWCGMDIIDSGLLCKARNTAIGYTAWNLAFKLFISVYLWFKSVKVLQNH